MKEIIAGHKAERDDLLKGNYVLREGKRDAQKSLQNRLIRA